MSSWIVSGQLLTNNCWFCIEASIIAGHWYIMHTYHGTLMDRQLTLSHWLFFKVILFITQQLHSNEIPQFRPLFVFFPHIYVCRICDARSHERLRTTEFVTNIFHKNSNNYIAHIAFHVKTTHCEVCTWCYLYGLDNRL